MVSGREFGPWVEHDGAGCPVRRGTLGEGELRNGRVVPFRALCGSTVGGPYVEPLWPGGGDAWTWGSSGPFGVPHEVVRYRLRKPRGVAIVEEILSAVEAEQVEELET